MPGASCARDVACQTVSTVVVLWHGLAEANPLIAHTVSLGCFAWVKLGVPMLPGTYVVVQAALSGSEAYNGWMVFALRGLAALFSLATVSNVVLALTRP